MFGYPLIPKAHKSTNESWGGVKNRYFVFLYQFEEIVMPANGSLMGVYPVSGEKVPFQPLVFQEMADYLFRP